MNLSNVISVIAGVVAVLTFVGPIIIWFGYLKYKVDSMDRDNKDLRLELKEGTAELRSMSVTVRAFASTQEVINKFTADTLSSIMHRLDLIEQKLHYVNLPHKD